MTSISNIDWQDIVSQIANHCSSRIARDDVLNIAPFKSESEALNYLQKVMDGIKILQTHQKPTFESLDYFSNWFRKVEKESLIKPIELKDIRLFCIEVIELKQILETISSEWCSDLLSRLFEANEPLSAIDSLITEEGHIRMDASEILYKRHQEKHSLSLQIQKDLDKTVKSFEVADLLQDKYVTTREGRLVLPIKSGSRHGIKGIIHSMSKTKQTVFMEPESVVPLNNRIQEIDEEIEEEIEKLLRHMTKYLNDHLNHFSESFAICLSLDHLFAKSVFSHETNSQPFQFNQNRIHLKQLRHPIMVLSDKNVISNNTDFQDKRILLLSGPNAGGKTVLLKSIGLAAHMARCGLPICAEIGSELPFFKDILVAIGDDQSVNSDLSTFAAHLKSLLKGTELKGNSSLILIDEICGATDPEEGSALARAFIEEYDTNEVFGVVTSHLSPLRTGWDEQSSVVCGAMDFNKESGRPTYHFIRNVSGHSYAIKAAERLGIPEKIIAKSKNYLSPETKKRLQSESEVEQLRQTLITTKKELNAKKQEFETLKKSYEQKIIEFEIQKETVLANEVKTAESKLNKMIDAAKVDNIFRKHEHLQKMKDSLPQIVTKNETNISTFEDFCERFPEGSKVYVNSLKQHGVIEMKANSKGDLVILSNSMRLTVNWQDLSPPVSKNSFLSKSSSPPKSLYHKKEELSKIDLRGKTSSDALEELEIALDRAVLGDVLRIQIVHGHGTESLKKSIRTYLSRSLYVHKWYGGAPYQGGDGITWAELVSSSES